MGKALLAVMVIMIAASGASAATNEVSWMARGQDAVKLKLRDPDSAQFRNVKMGGRADLPLVCGEVNSKNGFGGYTGFQRFVSGGRPDITFLESDVADFIKVWATYCK